MENLNLKYYDLLDPKILKTPMQHITVPTAKIAQDKSESQSASKAKRKKVPTTQITTPTKIVI